MFGECRSARGLLMVLCLGGVAAVGGCGGLKLTPVSGKVTVGDKAVTGGAVSYVADAAKGNQVKAPASGSIGPDGSYQLSTNGKNGAPPGWYKVVITTNVPGMRKGPAGTEGPSVNPRYGKQDTTPLSIEVKPDAPPGAYDLKLEP